MAEAAVMEVALDVGPYESAVEGIPFATGTCGPLRIQRVANPLLDEPDAGNPHVRVRGSPGGAIRRGHPAALFV